VSRPLVVANCSGFYGDRASAMREVLEGGPVDVVTGDYLAELTMLLLGRAKLKDPSRGYATTFARQLEDCLDLIVERGAKVVSNAGGLAPGALAARIRETVRSRGLRLSVAHVEGDDLLPRLAELQAAGHLAGLSPLTANAYLGAWGIARALDAGADVVVTGRVTDASVVVGPAAAHHGWAVDDWDALAGASVAGHVLECGCQATGGNFSFFGEIADPVHPGFPVAEIAADGSCVVTKHPGTGGAVTVETVTEQLLYECTGVAYPGPDVTARFDTVRLAPDGPDRVRLAGVRGGPPPESVKVAVNTLGGFRNTATVVLAGLGVPAKAALVETQLRAALAAAPPDQLRFDLAPAARPDADVEEEAAALLRVSVTDPDPARVGRTFSGAVVELALASVPGFSLTAPPSDASPYGVYSAAYVPASVPEHRVVLDDGTRLAVDPAPSGPPPAAAESLERAEPVEPAVRAQPPGGPTRPAPLGAVAGARSGDKGGTCTLGVYARSDAGFAWLASMLDISRLRDLLPETRDLDIERDELPSLRAVLFQLHGLLGEGVASSLRFDPQAKAVGEWLRARVVDVPVVLLEESDP
jgi:hypothetical protein